MKVKEFVELLLRCPQDDILLAEIGEDESADVIDALVGSGTGKGFSYVKIEPYRE